MVDWRQALPRLLRAVLGPEVLSRPLEDAQTPTPPPKPTPWGVCGGGSERGGLLVYVLYIYIYIYTCFFFFPGGGGGKGWFEGKKLRWSNGGRIYFEATRAKTIFL